MSSAFDKEDNLSSQLAAQLGQLLDGLPVGSHFEVPPGADICYCLELYLPRALREQYAEWEQESLDGFFVARATKTGPDSVELIGTAILISDQTVTPFAVELGTEGEGAVAVLRRLDLGEPGGGRLGVSGPPVNSQGARRLLATLVERVGKVTWSYSIRAGTGGSSPT